MTSVDFGLEFLPPFGYELFSYFQNSISEIQKHYSTLWICDHFQFQATPWLEGWTALSYLAGRFPQFRFGNLVLSSGYRNPAMLGKMAATLHGLTNGNFVLGLGAGWHEEEYTAYGYGFPSAKERVDRLEETLELIKALWNETPATYRGKYYRIENAYCEPKPKGKIPILIAGAGPRMLSIAAKYADVWNSIGPATEMEQMIEILWKDCKKIGRDPSEIRLTCVLDFEFSSEVPETGRDRDNSAIAKPEDAIAKIQSLTDLGISHVQTRFRNTKSFEIFCEKVATSFLR